MPSVILAATSLLVVISAAGDWDPAAMLPLVVEPFVQPVHHPYTTAQGLPCDDARKIGLDESGAVWVVTAQGGAIFDGERWQPQSPVDKPGATLTAEQLEALHAATGHVLEIRDIAVHQDTYAVAAASGLYLGNGHSWRLALPRQGVVRWAPVDVRGVTFDAAGKLWFAAPQGVGYRVSDEEWRLFTGLEGLPYNDFTCITPGLTGVWLGTTNGAIYFNEGMWSFRQGRRWLLDDHVRDIAVDDQGHAWIATPGGVSRIAHTQTTLAEKARFYEDEIEKYHRRTSYGYVNPARLSRPGDKHGAEPVFTDNDGHSNGLYLGAVSLGYAATGNETLRQAAVTAFRALAFLSEVTEGGSHPAPRGFIARAVLPTSAPDPNPQFDLEYDIRRNKADAMWKIIQPRWPVDESGDWYWKNDSSSDELDGHFFGFGIYYDHVCKTEEEKNEVREAARRIMDHILTHGYNLVDHDGKPTRWARFSPDDLNRNEAWVDERGLNSYSILTFLAVTHRITGDPKYREAYLELAFDHGYGMNGMTQPKFLSGPNNAGHQPDDNMAFMNYYHLIRYETDPKLLSMFYHAIFTHWQFEKIERNPFTNFVYAACCLGKVRHDHWGETDISPPPHCFEDAVDTLKRYPLDLVNWPMSNAHRTDMKRLWDVQGESDRAGGRRDGQVFPIDERHETYWDYDPWALTYNGNGKQLRTGVPFLAAYYMGLAHGFITE